MSMCTHVTNLINESGHHFTETRSLSHHL